MLGEKPLEREVVSRLTSLIGPMEDIGTLITLLERLKSYRERLESYVDVEDSLPVHGIVLRYESE
ncbi:MAG: hypothetical protein NZ988_06145 [Thaumarchaeota archaeon]|nr:hypothetical protein [Candidatus Calditenuaceae archaeon]MDW8187604.1 hypothetical protein [Nitrososphaerota archaeon]